MLSWATALQRPWNIASPPPWESGRGPPGIRRAQPASLTPNPKWKQPRADSPSRPLFTGTRVKAVRPWRGHLSPPMRRE